MYLKCGIRVNITNIIKRMFVPNYRCKHWKKLRSVLKELHWLSVQYRIIFKILTMTYKSLNGLAPLT